MSECSTHKDRGEWPGWRPHSCECGHSCAPVMVVTPTLWLGIGIFFRILFAMLSIRPSTEIKRGWFFPLRQPGEEVILILLLLLSLHHIVKWVGYVVFFICVCHFEINNGVSLVLTHMMNLNMEILVEAHRLFWGGVDSDFWMFCSCSDPSWADKWFITDGVGEKILQPHEGKGVSDFIVMDRH